MISKNYYTQAGMLTERLEKRANLKIAVSYDPQLSNVSKTPTRLLLKPKNNQIPFSMTPKLKGKQERHDLLLSQDPIVKLNTSRVLKKHSRHRSDLQQVSSITPNGRPDQLFLPPDKATHHARFLLENFERTKERDLSSLNITTDRSTIERNNFGKDPQKEFLTKANESVEDLIDYCDDCLLNDNWRDKLEALRKDFTSSLESPYKRQKEVEKKRQAEESVSKSIKTIFKIRKLHNFSYKLKP